MDWKNPDYNAVYERRIQRLAAMRADPAGHFAFYRDHPVQFIDDWGTTYDPRVLATPGRRALMPFILLPRQRDLIAWFYERMTKREPGAVEKSRDTGVSWCIAAFAVWAWLFIPGAAVGVGSYRQDLVDLLGVPRSLLEKCRIFIRNLPPELKPRGLAEAEHLTFMRLRNPENGAVIAGDLGDNIGRGDRAMIYFVDEAAHLLHQEMADASLAATSETTIYSSTAFGQGAFFQKCRSGAFPVFRFHWRDDPRKDAEWEKAKRKIVDPIIWAAEFDIDHSASIENVIILPKWIDASRELRKALTGKIQASVVGGLDVGGGKALSVFAARQGPLLHELSTWQEGDTTNTANRAVALVRKHGARLLNFDTVGIGEGVASTLRHHAAIEIAAPVHRPTPVRDRGVEQAVNQAAWSPEDRKAAEVQSGPITIKVRVQGINVGVPASEYVTWETGETSRERFANLKAELWWTMRDRLQKTFEHWLFLTAQEDGREHPLEDLLLLPDDDALATELSSPTWNMKAGGKIAVESKEQLAARGVKSPDRAEAVSLTFVPEAPTMSVETIAGTY